MDSAMLVIILALVGIITYLLFTPCKWLDKYAQEEKDQWSGEDIGENLIYKDQEGVPFVKATKPKKKRVYKRRKQ